MFTRIGVLSQMVWAQIQQIYKSLKYNCSRVPILFQTLILKLHFKSSIWTQFYKVLFQLSIT